MLLNGEGVLTRRAFAAGTVLWVFACVSWFVGEKISTTALHPGNDFYCHYVGSRVLRDGGIPYHIAHDSEAVRERLHLSYLPGTGYSYPPLYGIVLFPFLLLPPTVAAQVWIALMLALYVVFCYDAVVKGRGHANSFWTVAYLFTFAAARGSIANGQVNIVMLFLVSWYLYNRSAPRAGLSLALASMIKVFPGMLVGRDILLGRRRVVVGFALSIAALVAAMALAGYWKQTLLFFSRVLPDIQSSFDPYYTNQSVNGFVSRLFLLLGLPQSWRPAAATSGVALSVGLIAAACALTLARRRDTEALSLLWLGVTEVTAGKNSFWNLTPCLLIGLYLMCTWDRLRPGQRALALASMLGTNVLWYGTDALRRVAVSPTLAGGAAFIFHDVGFLSVGAQVALLAQIVWRGAGQMPEPPAYAAAAS